MRHLIVATAILVIAASAHGQSSSGASDPGSPPLIKSVIVEANDSPLVRAAKRAVASRQNASQRRVIKVVSGRGRVAQATGPTEGPHVPPPQGAPPPPEKTWAEQAAEKRKALAQERVKVLEQEQRVVGAEVDEPYGGDIEEDDVERRLSENAAERQNLQPAPPPPDE